MPCVSFKIKGSMTHLEVLQISMKFLVQMASKVGMTVWKV